jgi:pimeloyl-ACP methyl ester carboxylesterase
VLRSSGAKRAAIIAVFGLCLAGAPARAEPLPGMQSVQVHGQTIRFIEAGQGPTLVLVHGLGSSAHFDWGAVIPELSKHYHVLAMDQLGFGSSAKPLIAYGVQTWVDMLDGFLRARHVGHFVLAGESLGGWIAALYTIEAESGHQMTVPDRLILSDAAGHRSIVNRKPGAFGQALSIDGVRKGLEFIFHDHGMLTDDFVRTDFETQLAEGSAHTQDSFWKNIDDPETFVDDRLDAIAIPTLVVWGGDDRLIPVDEGRDYAARIKGAKLEIIPDCGHGPAIERPRDFLKIAEPFLAER